MRIPGDPRSDPEVGFEESEQQREFSLQSGKGAKTVSAIAGVFDRQGAMHHARGHLRDV